MSAPFLALAIDLNAGLTVMGCGLAATAYLTMETARALDGAQRRRLLIAATINAILAVICIALLIARFWD